MRRFITITSVVLITGFGIPIAWPQNYPHKLIRMVAPEAGGSSDLMARIIAQGISASLGQPVVVENQGAGSGIVAAQTVASAPADGYTLLLYSNGIWTLPLIQSVPYDPIKDFSPVIEAASSTNIVVVNPLLQVKSVKDLISMAKNKPGDLNYSSGGTGSPNHLAAELFKAMAGVNIVRINYKGTGAAINALIANQVQVMFATTGAATPHIKSGRLRGIAVTSLKSSALYPELPTVAASGLPGYESASTYAIFAPAKTPSAIVVQLNQEIIKVLNIPEVKEKLLNIGLETVGGSPVELSSAIKAEVTRMAKVIKDAGIRVDQ